MNLRPIKCFCACLVAYAVATAMPGIAAASDGDALTDKARVLYDEAAISYQKSNYAEARASLLAAWSLKKHWQIAGSLGGCEVQLGLYRDAAEHLAYFMRLSPNKPPSADTKALFEKATAKLGALVIAVDAPAADVVVDGKFIGKSPIEDPVFVEPGAHTIEARLGAKRATADATTPAGSSRVFTLRLVNAGPSTDVRADGPSIPVLATGGAVTGAALIAGVTFTLVSNGKASDAATKWAGVVKAQGPAACASASASGCQELHDLAISKSTFGSLAAWSFIGAGAVGISTLVYGLVTPKKAPDSGIRIVPVMTAQSGGLVIGGEW